VTASAILAALLALSPHPSAHPLPGWAETEDAHRARLASIAEDVASVARTPAEAAVLLGVAAHESGFSADVDAGQCYRGKGHERRCDAGRAVSLWQLQTGDAEARERWRTNRRAAAHEALRRALGSRAVCARRGLPTLALYASGSCEHGHREARELDAAIRRAQRAIDAAGAS
jgi:hypothetical protein